MKTPRNQRGIALIYTVIAVSALMAMISLAVDLGRVEMTKTQLQRAADAAARYGASGLANIINGQSAAAANAVAAAADNLADGTPVVLDPQNDVQLVIWNSTTGTYTVTNDPTLANGVRVTPQRSAARGNAVAMTFARLIGVTSCDITNVSAVATLVAQKSAAITIPATGNPFLAGMPPGAQASQGNPHNDPDTAGNPVKPTSFSTTPPAPPDPAVQLQSPIETGLPLIAGQALTFDGIVGGANNKSATTVFTADGNPGDIETNYSGNDNNIGNINAPLNALVGIFLDDNPPNQGSTPNPSVVDYSTQESRNFQTLSPPLKQVFFIGDGRTDDGQVQTFIPPAGATRLFLATWDGFEWSNNIGSLSANVHLPATVSLVK